MSPLLRTFMCDFSADAAAADYELYSQANNRGIRTTDADADVDETAVSMNVNSSPLSLVSCLFLLFRQNIKSVMYRMCYKVASL